MVTNYAKTKYYTGKGVRIRLQRIEPNQEKYVKDKIYIKTKQNEKSTVDMILGVEHDVL